MSFSRERLVVSPWNFERLFRRPCPITYVKTVFILLALNNNVDICLIPLKFHIWMARRGGAEVAGWTLDRKIRVRFPAYPHRVWALWWQGGKRRLRTSRCPCRGRLGTLKTPSCPWRGCPAAGQNLETGHLSRHYIAEISLNATLNHNQLNSHVDVRYDDEYVCIKSVKHFLFLRMVSRS